MVSHRSGETEGIFLGCILDNFIADLVVGL